MSTGCAVIVGFTVKPEHRATFMSLLRENAEASLAAEPGCLRFDIVAREARPEELWLYEIYTDRAAFDAHLHTAHFLSFDAATGDMIEAKTVIVGELLEPAPP
jgi:quinol monooxygenase YgiN